MSELDIEYEKYLLSLIKKTELIPKEEIQKATESLETNSNIPGYKTQLHDTESGFHLNVQFASFENTVIISKLFVVIYAVNGFIHEEDYAVNLEMALSLFSGSSLKGKNKIKWLNNYKETSYQVTIHQIYYVFYMLMYNGIIKFSFKGPNRTEQKKSQIIKRILNAFEPYGMTFPEYKRIDDSFKIHVLSEFSKDGDFQRIMAPQKPQTPNFEKITQTFITLILNSIINPDKKT